MAKNLTIACWAINESLAESPIPYRRLRDDVLSRKVVATRSPNGKFVFSDGQIDAAIQYYKNENRMAA